MCAVVSIIHTSLMMGWKSYKANQSLPISQKCSECEFTNI